MGLSGLQNCRPQGFYGRVLSFTGISVSGEDSQKINVIAYILHARS
jgi:hypothetical protein